MRFTYTLLLFLVSYPTWIIAQQKDEKTAFQWSGYGELYYNFDIDNPSTNELTPQLLYNHKRHNEVSLNLALIRGKYESRNMRSTVALMIGDYVRYNLSDESVALKNIYEANAGVKLSKTHEIWIDAGVFESYLGYENPVSVNCPTLSRSLFAENSPYYLTGIRAQALTRNQQWQFSIYYLNGWQRISKPMGLTKPSFGSHIKWSPSKRFTLSQGFFVGSDADSLGYTRLFNDLNFTFEFSKKLKLFALFDYGLDRNFGNSTAQKFEWYSYNLMLQYRISDKVRIAGRLENYVDRYYRIVAQQSTLPYDIQSYSLNIDYSPQPQLCLRVESRQFMSEMPLFYIQNGVTTVSTVLSTSMCLSF